MQLAYRYNGTSGIVNGLTTARLGFAINTLRDQASFDGTLSQPVLFREALAALYQVVVSDFKYRPKDRLAFQAWLEEQDRRFLQQLKVKSQQARRRMEELEARLAELNSLRRERLAPFHKARLEFFNFIYEQEYELQYLLDPVITVHPDEISFEAFSRDESIYARLAARLDLFKNVQQYQFGTTNIDFSAKLHGELERMRSYRQTRLLIDPGGLTVVTAQTSAHREKKIDLPDSWIKGFLQVHSTMTMSLTRLPLAAVDLFNICRYLRRRKAKTSPRALRYELVPGQKPSVVLEPWNHAIELTGSDRYEGPKPLTIRTWGRNRLLTIARLLPVTHRLDVFLAGPGLPSFYVFDLGGITFTLGLSGWTDNDWTAGTQKFDLLTRRLTVQPADLFAIHDALKEQRFAHDTTLSAATGLGLEKTRSALSYLCQVGRAMIDLGGGGVYRFRDLFGTPLTVKEVTKTIAAAETPVTTKEKLAQQIFASGGVRMIMRRPTESGYKISGSAKAAKEPAPVRPRLSLDHDGRIIEASCTCAFFKKYQLTQGPCEHILALRLAHMKRLEQEDEPT